MSLPRNLLFLGVFLVVGSWLLVLLSPPVCLHSLPEPVPFTEVNNLLSSGHKYSFPDQGRLRPEAFASDPKNSSFYSGLGNGNIVRFDVTKGDSEFPRVELSVVVRTGSNHLDCGLPELEYECGRPLGMEFHPKTGKLIVCDTRGLLEVDIHARTVTPLVTADLKFCNDVEITKDGIIYFSDSSTSYARKDVMKVMSQACSEGRIFRYDPDTKKLELIASELGFANGILLTKDEEELLVVETLGARVSKVTLKGPNKGKKSIFSDNLPGLPDNISYNDGIYWIGFATKRVPPFSLIDFIANKPWLRQVLMWFDLSRLVIPYGLVGGISEEGKLVRLLHDQSGELSKISELHPHDEWVFLGSWYNDFLGVVAREKFRAPA